MATYDPSIWLNNYPENVQQSIDVEQFPSIVAMIEQSLEKYKDRPAFTCMDKTLTYAQVDELSRNFAAYLQSLGLKKGDKFGIQMPNVLQYPIALFGALRAGLTVVNVNPLYTVREMVHQYNDAEVKAVIVLANFADKMEKTLPQTGIKHVIVTQIGDSLGGMKGLVTNFVVKSVKKMVPAFNLPHAVKFKDAIKKGKSATFQKVEVSGDDLAFLQYTGGTTGVSKGAMLSNKNIVANLLQVEEWFKGAKGIEIERGNEIMITALPLYHVYALMLNCLSMTYYGAECILIPNPRDMPGFVKTLGKKPFTMITGVNTLFNGLLNTPGFSDIDFSAVKLSSAGGMAAQKPTIDKWKEATGVLIAEGYGLSETSPVLTTNPMDGRIKIGSIGMPMPNTDLAIMDDDGNFVEVGETGEICAKGPQVMQGYWGRPEETNKVFNEDGWFKTGDIGKMDEEGYFYIVDRKKDMILVSGFNVYPNEIEEVVAGCEGVLEAAAIGVPDPKSVERVKVFVVKTDANLTEEKVIEYCKENLAGYKVPKLIEFRDELPKSNVGKILRRHLKEEEEAKVKATTA